jgi:dolichol-phosphate mannosyltransferase
LALIFFTPVIAWNAANDWASFYFQTIGRHSSEFHFGLHELVGSVLLLLTPTGMLSVAAVWLRRKRVRPALSDDLRRSAFRLLVCLTLVPLAVFFIFSLFRLSKLNWTGPVWLAMLPFVALFTRPAGDRSDAGSNPKPFFPRLWPATTAIVLVFYGAVLHYVVLGLPGVPYPHNMPGIGRRDLAQQIFEVAMAETQPNELPPLVVCWDAQRMAGWLAYYLDRASSASSQSRKQHLTVQATGPHFFGDLSQMFAYWYPLEIFKGRQLLFVSPSRGPLNYLRVLARATPLGRTQKIVARNHGKIAGTYFYRLFRAGDALPAPDP